MYACYLVIRSPDECVSRENMKRKKVKYNLFINEIIISSPDLSESRNASASRFCKIYGRTPEKNEIFR